MPQILHNFNVGAPAAIVFKGITTPAGLNAWWTLKSKGTPAAGEQYLLDFGPKYQWQAVVTRCIPGQAFELQMTVADAEWVDTKIGFTLTDNGTTTAVSFYHKGWRRTTDNYKYSSFCWAMYLRLLKRHILFGEKVPYSQRLSV